ncbi:hypothetical protein D3C80_1975480 [compost metagenome]
MVLEGASVCSVVPGAKERHGQSGGFLIDPRQPTACVGWRHLSTACGRSGAQLLCATH